MSTPTAQMTDIEAVNGKGNDWIWHAIFGGLTAVTLIGFMIWGHDYVDGSKPILLGAAILFALFMAFNIGGNDVANSFGTSVGAGTLSMKQALVVAAIFEVSGAILAGGEVTDTVRSGIVDLDAIDGLDPMEFVYIMMSSLLGAAIWLLVATRMGWPVSTTHSIVGGIVGAALAVGFITGKGGWSMVQWGEIGTIAISWVLSPVLGGIAAFILFKWIKTSILVYKAHHALESWVPVLAAIGAIIISAMVMFKGLKHTGIDFSVLQNLLVMGMVGAVVWMAVFIFARSLKKKSLAKSTFLLFSWMQVFTAFAFSHGSNDIANAIGPFAAVIDVLKTGQVRDEAAVPVAVMIAMGVALISGLWFIGRFVIQTVGSGLTQMHPSSGFAAELAAAGVVMGSSILGLPVSSTHILIGAVLGVGIVNKAANWNLMKPIALAWVITLPAAAVIAAITVSVLRVVF